MKKIIDALAGAMALVGLIVCGALMIDAAQATPGGDKPWICHPVNGKGETGYGWNLINPNQASSHIDEATGQGKHVSHDGRTDVYAVDGKCPGAPTEEPTPTDPTSEPTEQPTDPTSEPTETTSTPPVVTEPPVTNTGTPITLGPPVTTTVTPIEGEIGYPEVEVNCSAHKCTKITKNSQTGEVIKHEEIVYPESAEEEGL